LFDEIKLWLTMASDEKESAESAPLRNLTGGSNLTYSNLLGGSEFSEDRMPYNPLGALGIPLITEDAADASNDDDDLDIDSPLFDDAMGKSDYSLWQSGKLQHDSEMKNITAKYVHETLGWEEATEDFTLAQEQKQKRTVELACAKREYVLAKGKTRYHEGRLRGLDNHKFTSMQTQKFYKWALETPQAEKHYAKWVVDQVRNHCKLNDQRAWNELSTLVVIQSMYLRLFHMGFGANPTAPHGFSVYRKRTGKKDESVDMYLQRLKDALQWVDEAVTKAAQKRKWERDHAETKSKLETLVDDDDEGAPPVKRARKM
jgi:hypothetical protein